MNSKLEQTMSVWMQSGEIVVDTALTADITTDVCVVGAGIAGLTTAYLLLKEGKSVVILDDGPVGGGQTERTTAHLSNAIDDRYTEIESWHGLDGAKLAAESHTAAIDTIEAIVAREEIECDFERLDGFLFSAAETGPTLLENELNAARRAGIANVELIQESPITSFDTGVCLRFPRQGQFHPRKYLAGLTKAIRAMGGNIFTETRAGKIDCGPPARVTTNEKFTITATDVVVATNSPFNDFVTMHTKQAAYMSYVLAFRIPRGTVTRALFWDTEEPYHYVRIQYLPANTAAGEPAGESLIEELLIVGGEDHKTGQANDAEERYARLEIWTRERFPMAGERCSQWSGQVLETMDGLAYIGRNPLDGPNIFIATGDSGQGMTHGTIAGILLTDLIMDRENPWASLYDPSRKTLGAADRFISENVNVALQYSAWVTGGDISDTDDIVAGTGAVVRRGLTKVAAYRDETGTLHQCSAVCPHLGCIVEWNAGESTWDCPCHGSRFDKQGSLLCGPANCNLTALNDAMLPMEPPLLAGL